MIGHYILDCDHQPVEIKVTTARGRLNVPMLHKWAIWFEDDKNRFVARTKAGPFRVSSIFMGSDHCFMSDGPPILFETMVFNEGDPQQFTLGGTVLDYFPEVDSLSRRHCTWDECMAYHEAAVRKLRNVVRRITRAQAAERRIRETKR